MEFFPAMLTEAETRQRVHAYTREIQERNYGLWAVELTTTHEFIGFIGLHEATFVSAFTPCVEVGWRLAKRYWNRGYATEGARACIDYGFNKTPLTEISSFTAVLNKRSEHVMQKAGLAKVCEFDHPSIVAGHPLRPHVLYQINK
jgi:ribosomal-protein-alanine N-acetyltransferase